MLMGLSEKQKRESCNESQTYYAKQHENSASSLAKVNLQN